MPQFEFAQVEANHGFSVGETNQIRRAGCCNIRNTLPEKEVVEQNDALSRYIIDNDYYANLKASTVKEEYFSQLDSANPQIFGIYWSPAQIWARQHPNMDSIRQHLNRLWDFSSLEKDKNPNNTPTQQSAAEKKSIVYQSLTYADRIRRREPGDASLGPSPRVDSRSIERWMKPRYRHGVYRDIFGGDSST